ncbi:MAG: helix-hairpin-helix domain-containing protein [Caldilineaceae bacterium]
MLDLFPVELREPVWYILAGFILGFAISTLWEWLYYRRFRVGDDQVTAYRTDSFRGERIQAEVSQVETQTGVNGRRTVTDPNWQNVPPTPVLQASPEFEPAAHSGPYRSPTVSLNRERPAAVLVVESPQSQQIRIAELSAQSTSNVRLDETQAIEHNITPAEIAPGNAPESQTPLDIENELEPNHSPIVDDTPVSGEMPEEPVEVDVQDTTDVSSASQVNVVTSPLPEQEAGSEQSVIVVPSHEQVAQRPTESTVISEQDRSLARVPRSRGYPDELTKIRGIGEVYKRRLFAANIFTFHHVATSDIEVLRRATQAAPNANVESWPAQAETLAQKYQRTNASYSGPLPDDLQKIAGIGPYFAQQLYRNGICTYEQLADTSLEELKTIFPPSVLGRELNLQQVLDSARQKAAERDV